MKPLRNLTNREKMLRPNKRNQRRTTASQTAKHGNESIFEFSFSKGKTRTRADNWRLRICVIIMLRRLFHRPKFQWNLTDKKADFHWKFDRDIYLPITLFLGYQWSEASNKNSLWCSQLQRFFNDQDKYAPLLWNFKTNYENQDQELFLKIRN